MQTTEAPPTNTINRPGGATGENRSGINFVPKVSSPWELRTDSLDRERET